MSVVQIVTVIIAMKQEKRNFNVKFSEFLITFRTYIIINIHTSFARILF